MSEFAIQALRFEIQGLREEIRELRARVAELEGFEVVSPRTTESPLPSSSLPPQGAVVTKEVKKAGARAGSSG